MACNNIGNKVVCESVDEAASVDRRTNGDYGDSALDTLAGIPQFVNVTAKYATMTDSFFGENRPWKGNFFSADISVLNNPYTRLWIGLHSNICAGIWNTVSFGYFKEGLDAVGIENHLSPPPSTRYETYNYVNGNLLLAASALALYLKAAPKATAASQIRTAPKTTIDIVKLRRYAAEADAHIKAGTQPEGGWFEIKVDQAALETANSRVLADLSGNILLNKVRKLWYMLKMSIKDGVPLTRELICAAEVAGDLDFSGASYQVACEYLYSVWKIGGKDLFGTANAKLPIVADHPEVFDGLQEWADLLLKPSK